MSRTIFLSAFLILGSVYAASSQYATNLIPRISSDNSISEKIAYTNIKIEYGSPKVKGRKIWGELEQYDHIWRAGANKATTISFSEDVKIDGNTLPRGIYALFIIPREKKDWTIIFNEDSEQWGAFEYDAEKDALRIDVSPRYINHVEDLTFDIVAHEFESAKVSLSWEKIKLNFQVEVDYLNVLENRLNENLSAMPKNIAWVLYLQAAEYLIDENKKLDLAEKWLDESEFRSTVEGKWSGQYYPKNYILGNLYWAKAKLAASKGDNNTAYAFAQKMSKLEGDYLFHVREDEAENIQATVAKWQKKAEKRSKP